MLDGTRRDVLDLLLERPRSPTEVAEHLDVSVQTASRNLKELVERDYAERTRNGEGGRGYKRYRAREFAHVFSGYGGRLTEHVLDLSEEKRTVLSVWNVPQPEFHPVLLSFLFATAKHTDDLEDIEVVGVLVYGSVARGEADSESDVDVLVVYDHLEDADVTLNRTFVHGTGWLEFDGERVVSEQWFSSEEFVEGIDSGSQFLRSVLDEGITLYDPEGVIRDARSE